MMIISYREDEKNETQVHQVWASLAIESEEAFFLPPVQELRLEARTRQKMITQTKRAASATAKRRESETGYTPNVWCGMRHITERNVRQHSKNGSALGDTPDATPKLDMCSRKIAAK